MLNKAIIDVTSGTLSAKLHRERFICPGINRECIEFNDMFITPKTFYHLADKASLKDWKNAIRINGKKIRYVNLTFHSNLAFRKRWLAFSKVHLHT